MAVYPNSSDAPYTNPIGLDMRFKTLISNFDDNGVEKRKQKWAYPKRNIKLDYKWISKSEAETLWQFYQARAGSFNSFVWFESTGIGATAYNSYVDEYVGTGDSTTLVFALPAVDSSQVNTFYVSGVAVAATSNYTFDAGGGPDGEDKLTLVSSSDNGIVGPPSSTERITYDFTGRLKVKCRFANDSFSFDNFYDRLVNSGVELAGLLNS